MSEQEASVSYQTYKERSRTGGYHRQPNNFGEEGVDHINININSKTRLGMLFDPSYCKKIYYPGIGSFNSVSSLWYWLKSKTLDDRIRTLRRVMLVNHIRDNADNFYHRVPNFKAIIGQATWIKVTTDPKARALIKELPDDVKFLSYHTLASTKLRICSNYANLMVDVCTEIVTAVKQDREPDFTKFCDHAVHEKLGFLEGIFKKHFSETQLQELIDSLS